MPSSQKGKARGPRPARATPASHARDSKATDPKPIVEKRERVRRLVRLMVQGKYSSCMLPSLATQWRCSELTLQRDTAEASARVQDYMSEDEEARTLALTALERVILDLGKLARKNDDRNPMVAVRAVEAKGKFIVALLGARGLEAPKKVEVGGSLGELMKLAFDGKGDEERK